MRELSQNCDFCSSWKPSKEAFCSVKNPKLSCGLSQTSFWCSIHGYPQRFRWVFPMLDTCWYPNVLQNPPFLHIFLPFPDLKFSNPMKISGLDIPWHPDAWWFSGWKLSSTSAGCTRTFSAFFPVCPAWFSALPGTRFSSLPYRDMRRSWGNVGNIMEIWLWVNTYRYHF